MTEEKKKMVKHSEWMELRIDNMSPEALAELDEFLKKNKPPRRIMLSRKLLGFDFQVRKEKVDV